MESLGARPGMRIAVLGHARHGKSALVAALTRRAASRPFASKTRAVAFVASEPWGVGVRANGLRPTHTTFCVESPAREYTGLDAVAHRRLARQTGIVASSVDACILVVSAVDGVMAQTREHALFARHLTPGALVVFINRCDEVTDLDQLDLAEIETREALDDAGFEGDAVPVVRGAAMPPAETAALWARALDDLLDTLDHAFHDTAPPVAEALYATVLHRWHRPSREGRVVELSVQRGELRAGQRLSIVDRYGVRRGARVTSLRRFDAPVSELIAGTLGTALITVEAGGPYVPWRFPRSGDQLLPRITPAPTKRLRVRLRLLTEQQGGRRTPMRSGHEVSAWIAGRYLRCCVRLPDGLAQLDPGAACDDATLELAVATHLPALMPFVLCDGSAGDARRFAPNTAMRAGCFATGAVLALLG